MTAIVLIGIAGLAFVIVEFVRNWREWLQAPEAPSTHIAGEDDQEIDFDAAIRSIGGPR
jgi:hypothetical protein